MKKFTKLGWAFNTVCVVVGCFLRFSSNSFIVPQICVALIHSQFVFYILTFCISLICIRSVIQQVINAINFKASIHCYRYIMFLF